MNMQTDLFQKFSTLQQPLTTASSGTFYNTTGLRGIELKEKKVKINRQDSEVLEGIRQWDARFHRSFTPWDIFYDMGQKHLIGSVRRSINTLTVKFGYLEKTRERRRSGPAKENNYCWRLTPIGYKTN